MTCRSKLIDASGNKLAEHPCIREAGHTGQCDDGHGHLWTRLAEHLRERGQTLEGTRLRRIPQ